MEEDKSDYKRVTQELIDNFLKIKSDMFSLFMDTSYEKLLCAIPKEDRVGIKMLVRLFKDIDNTFSKYTPIIKALDAINKGEFNNVDQDKNAYDCLITIINDMDLLKLCEMQYIWDKLLPFLSKESAIPNYMKLGLFEDFINNKVFTRGAEFKVEYPTIPYKNIKKTDWVRVRIIMPEDNIEPNKESEPMVTNYCYDGHCGCGKCENLKESV